MMEEEYFNSLEEKRNNYEVGKHTSGSSWVKTYKIIFQLIIIVFLVLFYVMLYHLSCFYIMWGDIVFYVSPLD
jgi:uncharacterized membrane protein